MMSFSGYMREIAKGKNRKQVYTVVSNRLLYHVYSMMKNKKPYRQRLPNIGKGEGKSSSGTSRTASRVYPWTARVPLSLTSPGNLI